VKSAVSVGRRLQINLGTANINTAMARRGRGPHRVGVENPRTAETGAQRSGNDGGSAKQA